MHFHQLKVIFAKTLVVMVQLGLFAIPTSFAQETEQSAQANQRVAPRYPINQARNGQEGWVQLSFVIDEQGNVIDPFVVDSSGIKGFEKAALNAATGGIH